MEKQAVIRKIPDKQEWCVYSHKGKNMGCYDSQAGAKKRLQQVEYFKHGGKVAGRYLELLLDLELADAKLALEELGEIDSQEYQDILDEIELRFREANRKKAQGLEPYRIEWNEKGMLM